MFLKSARNKYDRRMSIIDGVPVSKNELAREAMAAGLWESKDIAK